MSEQIDETLFVCNCGDLRHIFRVVWERSIYQDTWYHDDLSIELITDYNQPLWFRVKQAIAYILKRKNHHLTVVGLNQENVGRLRDAIEKYLADRTEADNE